MKVVPRFEEVGANTRVTLEIDGVLERRIGFIGPDHFGKRRFWIDHRDGLKQELWADSYEIAQVETVSTLFRLALQELWS